MIGVALDIVIFLLPETFFLCGVYRNIFSCSYATVLLPCQRALLPPPIFWLSSHFLLFFFFKVCVCLKLYHHGRGLLMNSSTQVIFILIIYLHVSSYVLIFSMQFLPLSPFTCCDVLLLQTRKPFPLTLCFYWAGSVFVSRKLDAHSETLLVFRLVCFILTTIGRSKVILDPFLGGWGPYPV